MPTMTRTEFDSSVTRSGLPIDDEKRAELYEAFGKVEAMIALVTRDKPREAEPALIFIPGNVA